jgi:hypothetical protein
MREPTAPSIPLTAMNPAIPLLLRAHAASRLRRIRDTFRSTRRTILLLAAVALAVIWLGQTIASVMFREPYDPGTLHGWTSLILMLYFGWHFVRVAYKRPEAAIEWSPAEEAQIVGGPFRRWDVLIYRFLIILTSIFPKALLTAFVLLPDLWWSGLPGILLALVFLEGFRMAIDIAVCCLSPRGYLRARILVFSVLLTVVAVLAVRAGGMDDSGETATAQWLSSCGVAAESLRESRIGQVVERPFVVFADVITAQGFSAALGLNSLIVLLMVAGLLAAIGALDRLHESLLATSEQRLQRGGVAGAADLRDETSQGTLPRIPRMAAVGPILWRQLKSAGRYRGSLAVALAIPAVLSCLPLMAVNDTTYSFLVLVATVVFYSFVLLPEAIKFDFRLDSDHLVQLKMLPVSSFRMVVGQLAVPILLATLFQCGLYLVAGVLREIPPILITSAILLSVPVNVLFVAIDNLIFLLYPHRPAQEGFEAFVRTILKFTFKSVILGVAGGFVLFWALSSRILADSVVGLPDQVRLIFISGLCAAAWISAAAALAAVTCAFEKFDVSVSVPT